MTRLFTALLYASTCATLSAQEPVSQPPAATEAANTPSAILIPALDSLHTTLPLLRPEKWKVSSTIGQETQTNIASIQTDLQTTLPPLLAVADQNADTVAQVLPAFRNISALYDVVLRVSQVAALTAPSQQSAALQTTISTLEKSRRQLGDLLQTASITQNQQIHDLQAKLRTAQPAPAPVTAPCTPAATPAPVKKRKPRPKPAPIAPQATPQPAAPTGH